jgi:dynein heavy chain
MEAVYILFGQKADWDGAKKLLSMPDFMDQLKNYDKDNIDPKRAKQLGKYIAMEEFTPEVVGLSS